MLLLCTKIQSKRMGNKTKSMQQIRQILQLHERGKGAKTISRTLQLPRNTVKSYIRRWNAVRAPDRSLDTLDDAALSALILNESPPVRVRDKALYASLLAWLEGHEEELKRTGVTRKRLWEEYLEAHPSGYQYTQFCEYLGRRQRQANAVYSFDYRAGEYLMIDFAGKTLAYTNSLTGQVIDCQIFVAVLPCSNYLYVQAVETQQLADVVCCVSNALLYFGGVPQCVLSDNMRTAVRRADRYEPLLSEAFEQLSTYYNCTFTATRAARPRDKAGVERHVQIVYEQIFAPLRDECFHSLAALNTGITRQLDLLCRKPMQGRTSDSRLRCFEVLERPALRPLPARPFALRYNVEATVQRNYHIMLGCDRHAYSVPYQHIGRKATVIYDAQHVQIYIDNQCVATHLRTRNAGRTTAPEHMPPKHRHFAQQQAMTPQDYLKKAAAIGPACAQAIQSILQSEVFYRQSFDSCLGILSLAKRFGSQRLDSACALACAAKCVSYQVIRNILSNNRDIKAADEEAEQQHRATPEHHNIRGPAAYA